MVQRSLAAQQLQPDAIAEFLPAYELHQAHLAAALHMGAAAGTQVRAGELRKAHRPLQGFFAAVGQGG